MKKIEITLFWILIALILALAIWKLVGSPTDTAALISIALFIVGSEVLIWKNIFFIDKRTCIGFEKIKGESKLIKSEINNLENNLNKRLDDIELLIKARGKR